MSVCLTMIVKNEAHGIKPTLESVLPMIDTWCIVDTGSTDGTQDIVRDTLEGLPGMLYSREWHNFGENRTESLELASRSDADWLLILDAEWKALGSFHAPRADAGYCPVMVSDLLLRHPLVLKNGKPWHYVGAVHEYLDCRERWTQVNMSGLRFVAAAFMSPAEDQQAKRVARWTWDVEQLLAQHKRLPHDSRTVFNLANTYRQLGNAEEAVKWFDVCVGISQSGEERFYAAYMSAALVLPDKWRDSVVKLLAAWRMRPTRAEPLWELTAIFRQLELHDVADYFESERVKLRIPNDHMIHLRAYGKDPYVVPLSA